MKTVLMHVFHFGTVGPAGFIFLACLLRDARPSTPSEQVVYELAPSAWLQQQQGEQQSGATGRGYIGSLDSVKWLRGHLQHLASPSVSPVHKRNFFLKHHGSEAKCQGIFTKV